MICCMCCMSVAQIYIYSLAGCVPGQSHNSECLSQSGSDNRSGICVYFFNRHTASEYLFLLFICQCYANETNLFYKYYWRIYDMNKISERWDVCGKMYMDFTRIIAPVTVTASGVSAARTLWSVSHLRPCSDIEDSSK